MATELSVLLPVYNEEENLPAVIEELDGVLKGLGTSYEIIVVDDGSKDGSAAVLEKLILKYPNLKAVFFRVNRGQTAAFDAGFRSAEGRIIATMDADMQNDPHDLPKMLKMIDEGYDFVVGWRKNRKDGFVFRKLPSRIANWIIRRVTKTRIHDLGCSLKVYKKEITDELRLYGEMHRFIGVLCESAGGRVGELIVNHRPRIAGTSKYNLSRTVKVILDLITIWFLRSYETKPIYVFGGIAFALFGAGSLMSGYVLWEKYMLEVWVHRNPLFILAVICFVLSAQFIALGLIAELIIRTYFESQAKRPYSISHRLGFKSNPAG